MSPTILGVIGPGFLNQVPTLAPTAPRRLESGRFPSAGRAYLP